MENSSVNSQHNESKQSFIYLDTLLHKYKTYFKSFKDQKKITDNVNDNNLLNSNDCNNITSNNYLNKLSKCNPEGKHSFIGSLSKFIDPAKRDPNATKYITDFKKYKHELVLELFTVFNKEVFDNKLPANLKFKWNKRLKTTAGKCFNDYNSVKISGSRNNKRISWIELSTKINRSAEVLRSTIIHELCHAACWILNCTVTGHGPLWKNWATKAMHKFPELPEILKCHRYDVMTKYTYSCIYCDYRFGRNSISFNIKKIRCTTCFKKFIINENKNCVDKIYFSEIHPGTLKDIKNLDGEKSKSAKKQIKFSLFVKENYSTIKQENPLLKHGEIMKLLGSRYTTIKNSTN